MSNRNLRSQSLDEVTADNAEQIRKLQLKPTARLTPPTSARVGAGGGRWATVVVAAANSSQEGKDAADFVCGGSHDEQVLTQAMRACPLNGYARDFADFTETHRTGRIVLLEGDYEIENDFYTQEFSNGPGDIYPQLDWQGMGPSTILHLRAAPSFGVAMFHFCDADDRYHYVSIRDLTIDLHRISFVEGVHSGCDGNIHCYNVDIFNVASDAYGFWSDQGILFNCRVLNDYDGDPSAVGFHAGGQTQMIACSTGFSTGDFANIQVGVETDDASLVGCDIRGQTGVTGTGSGGRINGGRVFGDISQVRTVIGVECSNIDWDSMTNVLAQGNLITGGIRAVNCTSPGILANHIQDSQTFTRPGIDLQDCLRASVIGNSAENDGSEDGLSIDAGCDRTYYFANDFYGTAGITDAGSNSDSTSTNRT